jgi:selenocysteine lyase/cysteine desulfurase
MRALSAPRAAPPACAALRGGSHRARSVARRVMASSAPPAGVASSAPPAAAQLGQPLPGEAHEACAYLDYNATTPIYPQVAAAMEPFLHTHFGNPSCNHAFARPCKRAVEEARRHVAALLNCDADEI